MNNVFSLFMSGYWTGHHDYFDHTAVEQQWGFDIRRNMDIAYDLHGKFLDVLNITHVFLNHFLTCIFNQIFRPIHN